MKTDLFSLVMGDKWVGDIDWLAYVLSKLSIQHYFYVLGYSVKQKES